jgi:glycosyltransferase involved in cell wall biosynthesis
MTIIFITTKFEAAPKGGRQMLSRLNHSVLNDIYGNRLKVFEIPKYRISKFISAFYAMRGYIDGVDVNVIKQLFQIIAINNIKSIFIDGSNFGELACQVKQRFPNIKVYTFFHNVEISFFIGSFKQHKSIRAFLICVFNYLAEKKSVKYSDELICLSERDSQGLNKIYGRHASHILPMALHDELPSNFLNLVDPFRSKYALFVGGDFYANRVGISWFVKNVAPNIHFKVCVVGKGLERYKQELESVENVEVIGAVDSLSDWYLNAHFVIAPIFDGSGMKTKVAEALMYGKKVIGTPEAFSGYEADVDKIGKVCLSEADFIKAIEQIDDMVASNFDKDLRAIYEKKYSSMAAKNRFQAILNEFL